MDRMARNNPKWFFQKLTVDDTGAISQQAIQDDRDSGMSEAMIQQEYYCSYDLSIEGAYYSEILSKMTDNKQLGVVNHDDHHQVHIILDFGYTTAIWFVQEVGVNIHCIRYYEESGKSIEGYAKMFLRLQASEGYEYGSVVVPCDMDSNATRIITGQSALDTLRDLGFNAKPLRIEKSVKEGIARTIKFLQRCYIDIKRCEPGIVCLEQYHEKLNKAMSTDTNPVFTGFPDKTDGYDHGADAMRYVSKAFVEHLITTHDSSASLADVKKWEKEYSRTG